LADDRPSARRRAALQAAFSIVRNPKTALTRRDLSLTGIHVLAKHRFVRRLKADPKRVLPGRYTAGIASLRSSMKLGFDMSLRRPNSRQMRCAFFGLKGKPSRRTGTPLPIAIA